MSDIKIDHHSAARAAIVSQIEAYERSLAGQEDVYLQRRARERIAWWRRRLVAFDKAWESHRVSEQEPTVATYSEHEQRSLDQESGAELDRRAAAAEFKRRTRAMEDAKLAVTELGLHAATVLSRYIAYQDAYAEWETLGKRLYPEQAWYPWERQPI